MEIISEKQNRQRSFLNAPGTRRTIVQFTVLVFAITMVVTFTMKPVYMVTSKVLVERLFDQKQPSGQDTLIYCQTQCEIIKCEPILEKVIQDLTLQKRWAKTGKIPLSYAVRILKRMVNVRHFKGTNIIDVNVFSYCKKEAAEIANCLVCVYLNSLETEEKRLQDVNEKFRIMFEVIESAKVPLSPVRPRKMLNLIVSIFIGFVLGVVVAFWKYTARKPGRRLRRG